ncbi:response regulator transcription factor [Faecalicatena faecalis]|uniref:response regulator transcription factor n=1 Tax=Faecalicatena faecalis TaxID=2726362 RepID=UPI002ED67777
MLVDDHKLFAKSLAIALEEYEEIEEFHYITQLLDLPEMIKSKKIDIVLMDINLGKLSTDDGLSIARGLKKNAPDAKIIMLTGYDLPVYKYEARQMGASGFLNKNISPDQLVDALLAVNQNQTCFPAEEALIIEELTSMEKKILSLVSIGKKRRDIAAELYISERTLSNHLQHIYEKLDVDSSVEAVTKAIQMGYLAPLF